MKGRTRVVRKKEMTSQSSLPIFAASSEDFDSSRLAPTSVGHDSSNLPMLRPQAKLTVSQPRDLCEIEADRVADQVMRMEKPGEEMESTVPQIARKEQSDLQLADDVTPIAHAGLQSSGELLDADTRAFMELRFGHDFSQVRVHTNARASQSSEQLAAHAYTASQDVVFASGQFAPNTTEGKRLLAHELTHVVQHGAAPTAEATEAPPVLPLKITPAPGSELSIQRQATSAPPKTVGAAPLTGSEKLDADYQDALAHSLWTQATVFLNGFNNNDIKKRVALLTPEQRQAMRAAVPEWNARVRAALLDLDFYEAVMRTDWIQAAIHLNGFNDADIDERVAHLPKGQATNLAAGAIAGMRGISQQRIVDAVDRLQQKLDAGGSQGALGTNVISDVVRLQQQGANIETARAVAFKQLKVLVRPSPAGAKADDNDRKAAITMIAGAMAGAVIAEPGMLSEGKLAHAEIGMYYASFNKPTLVDPSLITVIRALKLTKAAYDQLYARLPEELLESLLVRPDIMDLGKMQVYEIKSFDSAVRAVPEMLEYIELLESFQIPGIPESSFKFHPGSPQNPGTSGFLPTPKGVVIFCCPVPGAIVYRLIGPTENPRTALERLKNELQGSGNMMVGVESLTAISVTLAAGFEELIPLLIAAARAVGQAIPEVAKSWPKLPQVTGPQIPAQ